MAVVLFPGGEPRRDDMAGVITKEHVADSVTDGISLYPRG
jgi:CIC family chloride channel protein